MPTLEEELDAWEAEGNGDEEIKSTKASDDVLSDAEKYKKWLESARAEMQKISLKAMWDALDFETSNLESSQIALVKAYLRTSYDKAVMNRIKLMRATMVLLEIIINNKEGNEALLRNLKSQLWLLA